MSESVIQRTIQRAVEIQKIPAPTFEEQDRAAFIFSLLQKESLADLEMDMDGNVFARLPGQDSQASPVIVSAHTDTVFPAGTDLTGKQEPGRIYGPGIGDNSLGVAGLFGLLWMLREEEVVLPVDLWLAANVGEEGLGDLSGMKRVYERFGSNVAGYIILEGLALGRIYHRGLGVRRYRISVTAPGGHSWVDYGSPSAIHELSLLVGELLKLRPSNRARTSLNVGVIRGGVSINTIAPYAELELDLRSEDGRILESLARKVENIAQTARRSGVGVTCEVIGDRPFGEIPAEHPLVQIGIDTLAHQGYQANLQIGSTDANIPLSQGAPAICIGLSHGQGAHTENEYMETEPLGAGMAHLLEVVRAAAQLSL